MHTCPNLLLIWSYNYKKAEIENLLSFTTHALFIASVLSSPFLVKQGLFPNKIDLQSIFAILYLGIIPTGIATIILIYLIVATHLYH